MNKLAKRARQTLTMLLASSMLAGSIPVNAFAMEGIEPVMEATAEAEDVLQGEKLQNNFQEIYTVSENVVENQPALKEKIENEELQKNVSDNETEKENKIQITFSVSANSAQASVKITQIIENKDGVSEEKELQDNVLSTIAEEKIKFKLEPSAGYKVTKVKMGNNILTTDEKGIYSVSPAETAIIDIYLTELEKYDVSFSYDEEQVQKLQVYMGNEPVTLEDNIVSGMVEGSEVTFYVTLEKWMKIVKVTANGKELKATDQNVYKLENMSKDVDIEIITSLDEKECYTLAVHVMGDYPDAVTVWCGDEIYGHGDVILTQNKNESITLFLKNKYVITDVKLDSETLKFKGPYRETYNLDFSQNKDQVVFIYADAAKIEKKKQIVFANKASNITYEVNTAVADNPEENVIEKDELKKDTYLVSTDEITMKFNVICKDGYEPVVNIVNTAEGAQKVEYSKKQNGNIHTYSLVVATLGNEQDPTLIEIDEIPQIRTISVFYDKMRMEKMDAIVDGKYIDCEEIYDSARKLYVRKYEYVHGTEIMLQIETKPQYMIGAIKESVGDKVFETKPQAREYTYIINTDKSKKIELLLEDAYTIEVCDVLTGELLYSQDNIYLAESKREYKARLCKGDKVQIVTNAVLARDGEVLEKELNMNSFEIPQTEIGKIITLEADCIENGEKSAYVVSLKVLPENKITKIASVKNGKLSQTADTIKEYEFVSNLSQMEDRFAVEIVTAETDVGKKEEEYNKKANENFAAEIVDNKLKVTVKTSKADEEALIKIYDVSKSTSKQKAYVSGGTILVTSKAPAFITAKPSATLKNATNLSLILNLGMKKLDEIENGEYWYKIEGISKNKAANATSEFVEYVKYTDLSQVESIRVVARDDQSLKEGEFKDKTDYTLRVSLIQTTKKIDKEKGENLVESGTGKNVAFISKPVEIKASTKKPSYETKLGVKTTKTTVYSGQQDVIVAEPVFSKTTSYQRVAAAVKQEDSGILVSVDKNNRILVSADETTKPGKYIIELTAEAADTMVPAKKEFTIQVVQGIYEISVETPGKLYKEYKKKATVKVGITYNEEDSKAQPKMKKVDWVLLDSELKEIDKKHPKYKMFSIKDGVVTIAQDFIISNIPAENEFYVKAIAKDFERKEGEELFVISEKIVITNKKAELGELVLVKETEDGSSVFDLIARSDYSVAIDKVNGSKLMMLKKGVPEKEQYVLDDFMINPNADVIYTVNHKMVDLEEDNTIAVKGVASGVTFTVEAIDGSNVKKELSNLTITYGEVENLGISVSQNGMIVAETFNSGDLEFYGPKDETLTICIQKENEHGKSADCYGVGHLLKVEGAKIIESDVIAGKYEIVGTADTIILQLTNNTTATTKTFTLKNASLATQKVRNSKALQLKTEGTLKTGEFGETQTITFALPKDKIGKYTYAYVTVDRLDYLNKKNAEYYDSLIKASAGAIGKIQKVSSDGKVKISFSAAEGENSYYIPEANFTYKLNIAFGSLTEDYEFKADVNPSAVTIKTKNVKIANAKLVTSYGMSIKEGGMAKLALNNKKTELTEVGELRDNNNKGKKNNFTKFFMLDKDDFTIKLKPNVNLSELTKNDYSGYITKYTYTDGVKEKTVYNTLIKITLKKQVQKYTLSKATVLSDDVPNTVINTNVSLMAGKTAVRAQYLYVPEDQMFEVNINDIDGSLNLQSNGNAKIKSTNKCKVYVVPENSYYIPEIDEIWENKKTSADPDLIQAIKDYGMELTAVVNVKKKANTTGKIKFAASDLKPKFTEEQFIVTNSAYLEGKYEMKIPYTLMVDWDVKDVSYEDRIIKIEKTISENSVTVMVNKEALRDAHKAKDKKYDYGKTVTVSAIATFGANTKDEKIAFKVTLPKQPIQLQEATDKLKNYGWSDLKAEYKDLKTEEIFSKNQSLVEEVITDVLSIDGDLKYEIRNATEKTILPTEEKDGKLVYEITLQDVKTEKEKFIDAEIILEKTLKKPEDLVITLQGAIERWGNKSITNLTSVSEILSGIKKEMKIEEKYPHLRLYVKDAVCVKAGIYGAGYIKGNLCIVNVMDKDVPALCRPFDFEIPQLMTFERAAQIVKETIEGSIIVYNEELYKDSEESEASKEKKEEILKKAKEVLAGHNYYVKFVHGARLEGTRAEGDTPGVARIKLEIISLTTECEAKEITCELKVLAQKE